MAKTKTKGTAKTVSDTPVPQPITISSTNPKIMADNIKKLEKAIKGADDASEISYDNTASHLTATNVQAAIDEIAPALDASGVSYDNTDSGLTADDVQAAINELNTKITKYDLSAGETTTVDTTDFIPVTMTSNGYITIFTLSSGGTDSIDIAINTSGTNLFRLGTANGAYQFASMYLPKGAAVYIKASAANIGGYFITSIT